MQSKRLYFMKTTTLHLLTFVVFLVALCEESRPEPASAPSSAAESKKTLTDIKLDDLCQHWVHSREEERSADKDQIFRPAAFKKFPPSWFRMEYKFARNGDCEWLFLAPNDAHRLKSGKWILDPKDKTIIRITKEGTTSSYRITALRKDILRLLPESSK
jgi:hypothetical protein